MDRESFVGKVVRDEPVSFFCFAGTLPSGFGADAMMTYRNISR
jgi:hypothetical protein